ncbi:MAG: tRNA 4-thiouridine(8) synthase ThiI [Lachnospiraceae bacterium]|nr:tRNA 4-thiouridine(8) synthase ThiI [Lachnospiraceae bacterium]MBQ4241981.1 tRNA 4-thiouridine(8) synthase ThiI [Lachnospiraceae bacterium]
MFRSFLIKYGEIGVKGKNRYIFEDALMKQIKNALRKVEGSFAVTKDMGGRIFVEAEDESCDMEAATEALRHVFGVVAFCPVEHVKDKSLDNLKEAVVSFVRDTYDDRHFSFKINTRRAHKSYPYTSMQVDAALGEAVLTAFPETHVDVHHPEVDIRVELRDVAHIYSKEIPGAGGMPIGTNGKCMLLLSGGIDSPVAGYMTAKRGVVLDAVYFHAPPYTSDRARQKVIDLAAQVSRYTGPIYLHIINFTDIQLAIYEKCPHDELTIIMRRYMMRIAESIAARTECLGLITGESIGQVASQTLQSLYVTDSAVRTMPVYRPLIGMDKQEIVNISEKIGTYETSILPYEDCCTIFVAKHPVTKPKLEIIERSEHNLDSVIDALMEEALRTDELVIVGKD